MSVSYQNDKINVFYTVLFSNEDVYILDTEQCHFIIHLRTECSLVIYLKMFFKCPFL